MSLLEQENITAMGLQYSEGTEFGLFMLVKVSFLVKKNLP